ncbi:DNA-directed RNA polymerase [Zychaea mexicana]|uniref:DNA-directed RNA polymerase n=1 Tax=Zychaea mexicana TaxID=64656 RepID=UPI0022FF159A|nr:DNA-directed RNA polymerase [Zychaea mexicana]KAI9491278.1 DNA-directed RNA polymerase [Zychaea mexicana]
MANPTFTTTATHFALFLLGKKNRIYTMSANEDAMSTSSQHEDTLADEEMAEASDAESEFGPIDKLDIVAGADNEKTAMTFSFKEEDHTLGNSLRHMINKNPEVDFCGYSIPHPSEAKMHMRVQTTNKTTAVDALTTGLDSLNDLCKVVLEAYEADLAKRDYVIEN